MLSKYIFIVETDKRLLKNKFSENFKKGVYKPRMSAIMKIQINNAACRRKGKSLLQISKRNIAQNV